MREGVKFHDGSAFDADDVIYSFEVFMDPKYNFRFKDNRFGWIDKVEKIDAFTVRITSKELFAPFLDRLTANVPIYPENVYRALENKGDFGRNPVGTGPYRVVSFDPAKGEVVYERNEDYAMGDVRRRAAIKRIMLSSHSRPADADREASVGRSRPRVRHGAGYRSLALRANPNLAVSVERTVSYTYIQFDTKDRTGIGVFKDKRVREALLKAIDRPALSRHSCRRSSGTSSRNPRCATNGTSAALHRCSRRRTIPMGAKKLLTEAGYPNGFELSISDLGAVAAHCRGGRRPIPENRRQRKVDSSTMGCSCRSAPTARSRPRYRFGTTVLHSRISNRR